MDVLEQWQSYCQTRLKELEAPANNAEQAKQLFKTLAEREAR